MYQSVVPVQKFNSNSNGPGAKDPYPVRWYPSLTSLPPMYLPTHYQLKADAMLSILYAWLWCDTPDALDVFSYFLDKVLRIKTP